MDPHIFADPDPGSQNPANPTDPDPKHRLFFIINHVKKNNYFKKIISETNIQFIIIQKKRLILLFLESFFMNCSLWSF